MINTHNSDFVIFIAGLAFFLYGMNVASQSLEKLMASRISHFFSQISDNRFLSILVGICLTVILQSSAAVTSMLVGLGSARVINIQQVMGVIIGTAIGSTITVQLISLNLYEWALPLFSAGFFIYFRSKKNIYRSLALVMIGFSFIFLGLRMVALSSEVFAAHPFLTDFFKSIRDYPIYSFLASMIFCALVQSSAVTIGLAMSLAAANAITFSDALIWVYGANVGTTSVALLAATNSNYIGKQVAWAHFFYKTVSVLIFFPLNHYFAAFLLSLDMTVSRGVANAHLIFNVLSALIFFPFIKVGARFVEKLFPQNTDAEFGTAFVNLNNYQTAALAMSYAQREVSRTADIVLGMIQDSIKLFENNSSNGMMIESIRDRDNKVDFLYRETKMFLLDHANKGNAVVHKNVMDLIMYLSDLERAADSIDLNIVALAEKKYNLKLEFSNEGWQEIQMMHTEVCKVAAVALNSFEKPQLSKEAIQLKRQLTKTELHLRENHISRLNKGIATSINTSSIHLDLLSEYRRIVSLLCNHAYKDLKRKDRG
ncbi:MAG: Na/Pi cotransporter family protein [Pseudobdellovibrionaceae bacterium]